VLTNNKIKNKKAFLLGETLNIVIALACIVLLFILAFKLYGIFIAKSDLEKARATLDDIAGKANALNTSEFFNYLVVAPKDWNLVAFSSGEKKLCICPEGNLNNYENFCNQNGACRNTNFVFDFRGLACRDNSNRVIDCFKLEALPLAITLSRQDNKLFLQFGSTEKFTIKNGNVSSNLLITKTGSAQNSIDFIDFLEPLPGSNAGNSLLYAFPVSGEDYILLSQYSTLLQNSGQIPVGRIEKDGSIWFSTEIKNYFSIKDSSIILDGADFNLNSIVSSISCVSTKPKDTQNIKYISVSLSQCNPGTFFLVSMYKTKLIADYNALVSRLNNKK